jgi:hypothetical protein
VLVLQVTADCADDAAVLPSSSDPCKRGGRTLGCNKQKAPANINNSENQTVTEFAAELLHSHSTKGSKTDAYTENKTSSVQLCQSAYTSQFAQL